MAVSGLPSNFSTMDSAGQQAALIAVQKQMATDGLINGVIVEEGESQNNQANNTIKGLDAAASISSK